MHFLDWDALGFDAPAQAENGVQAARMLEQRRYDVVISDIRMPGMDGLALAKWLSGHDPAAQVILLTAYADFSYAQAGIQSGVIDYVVKSNPLGPLQRAVERAVQRIESRRAERDRLLRLERALTAYQADAEHKRLCELLSGAAISPADMEALQRRFSHLAGRYCCVIVEPGAQQPTEQQMRFVLAFFASRADGHALRTSARHCCALLPLGSGEPPDSLAHALISPLQSALNAMTGGQLRAGISAAHQGMAALEQAYRQAHDMLFCAGSRQPLVFWGGAHQMDAPPTGGQLEQLLQTLQIGIDALDDEALRPLIQDALTQLLTHNESTLWRAAILQALVGYIAGNAAAPGASLMPYVQAFVHLQEAQNVEQITGQLLGLRGQRAAEAGERYSPSIRLAIRYIYENYPRAITLSQIAQHVHLNDSYLSRRYKQEVGENILSTITRLRIEQACRLLARTKDGVAFIGLQVGYEDAAHFCNVFKRCMGITPSDYRA